MTAVLTQTFFQHALLAGTFIALASGLVGCFLVLRAQIFTGDALSHVAFTSALAAAANRRAARMTPRRPADDAGLIGRPTPQRAEVLEALAGCEEFVSTQVLYARLVQTGSRVGLSTVYRTLTALTEAGRADVVRDANGERLFRYRACGDHRHYLICRQCGLSLPVDSTAVEAWADHVAEISGFADVRHTVELTGTCATCLAARTAD
ncbi:transcriptional repressor [Kitasatospora sp. GP82]|uniref:Fur family transcriptional regulator n=1 Tax=Kitasatospora sp. GP82 TaxID=3035089 RepID=UPI0024746618|nr:transcriptional repressor [Kitasatospora sp. GP82]MDH6130324.1 Fur family ferric uptake transcriptional regulator [Kitasatospora sp. GP82]